MENSGVNSSLNALATSFSKRTSLAMGSGWHS